MKLVVIIIGYNIWPMPSDHRLVGDRLINKSLYYDKDRDRDKYKV